MILIRFKRILNKMLRIMALKGGGNNEQQRSATRQF